MKRAAAVAAAVVVAALAGLAGLVVGLQERPPGFGPGGTDTFVNDERPAIETHNSPSLAADPSRPGLVVVAERTESPLSCSLSVSTTGGATWRPLRLPLAPGAENCFWPSVAFDPGGRLLVLYTATGGRYNLPVGVWLQPFAPGDPDPRPDGPAVAIAGPLAYHARLAVHGARAAIVWVQAGPATAENPLGFAAGPNPVVLARSEDGGRTFSPPVAVGDPAARLVQPTLLLGPAGLVVVAAFDLGDDLFNYESRHGGVAGPPPEGRWRLVTWRSDDGGARFGPARVVAEDAAPQRILANLGPAPGLALDPAGTIAYVAWDGGVGDARDVRIARSDDGGQTWSPPRPVAPGPKGQFLPAVAVSPGGRVDVLFYDRRRDPADLLADVVLASSWDGAVTFSTTVLSDRASDSSVGLVPGMVGLGSHLALLARDDSVLAAWADTRRGSVTTGAQDLAVATVEIRPGRGARPVLAAAGAGVLVAAAAPAVPAIRRRGRRRTRSDEP